MAPCSKPTRRVTPKDKGTGSKCGIWRGLAVTIVLLFGGSGCKGAGERMATAPRLPEPIPVGQSLAPSNDREWSPDVSILAHADFEGDHQIRVHNIRHCTYRSDDEYVVRHYDKTFDLDRIQSVDFIVVPFTSAPNLAHTMLSFGFEGGEYVSISVEARREKHESYSAVLGALRQFEIIYVVADERDVLLRRTQHRDSEVYLYPTRITPEQARWLFVDMMRRVNKLYREPEFYDSLTNNCTINLVHHLQKLQPGRIHRYDPRALLPGYADQLAYELGLLDERQSFAQLREQARINGRANRFADAPDFSTRIRR